MYPTLNELGIKGYEASFLSGLVGPAGMPPQLLQSFSKDN
jgi:tripartite-type tricarboxylate transporter receptor subunit TctC